MTSVYYFTLEGRFKPYVRMTQRGKYVKKAAQEYLSSQKALAEQFNQQLLEHGWEMLPGQTPLYVQIWIRPARFNRDLSNEIKAVEDAMQGIVFPDDRWVAKIEAVKVGDGNDVMAVYVGVL